MIRRCGLAGGSVSLGVSFGVPKAQARPSLSFRLWIRMSFSLSYCSSTMSAALLPAMMMG